MSLHKISFGRFLSMVYTPAGSDDATLAIAACRAGGLGVLNAEFSTDQPKLIEQIHRLTRNSHNYCGLKLDILNNELVTAVEAYGAYGLNYLILEDDLVLPHREWISKLKKTGMTVLVEIRSFKPPEFSLDGLVDGVIVKGHEAGGLVGENSIFILVQKWCKLTRLPIFVRGGLTPHTAAACAAIGFAGGILDSQVLLLQESPLVDELLPVIGKLSGYETVAVGSVDTGEFFRLLLRPNNEAAAKFIIEGEGKSSGALKQLARGRIDWTAPRNSILPIGQDVCFAAQWRRDYKHMADLLRAMDHSVENNLEITLTHNPLAENSPLAKSLDIALPVVQGPMAQVSDNAEFAEAVSNGGGGPTIALSLCRSEALDPLLARVAEKIGDRTWGVGLMGFAPRELLDEQLRVVHKYKPRFAVIAGGRPEQAVLLEKSGINAFLHVPSPDLIPFCLKEGAHRLIFEGRECGGHVGPLCSFVLWSTMVDRLLDELDRRKNAAIDIQILFAGGIHDAVSAAIIEVLAAPLLSKGVKIGIQMGTGYLFTREIVATGALRCSFQKNAIDCEHTVCLQSGPGHASRCVYTAFAKTFIRKRLELLEAKVPAAQCREQLDKLSLGRLRLASKGCARWGDHCTVQAFDERFQQQEGMYMVGQSAILRQEPTDIATLHREVTYGAADLLAEAFAPKKVAVHEGKSSSADIAVIGMACLLPKAESIEAFWENILSKTVCLEEIPDHRWDWKMYYEEDRHAKDKIYSRWGGFIDDVVFEPIRYGIPPKSIASVDPVQLMALEVARRTLEDAGYAHRSFDREHTSVIIGCSGGVGDVGLQYGLRAELPRFQGDLPDSVGKRLPRWTEDTFAGILPNVVAGRIANRFNLGGINFTTDAACASSMAALYQGVTELISGRSNFVITGGVDSSQGPFGYMCFSKTQALSPIGRCATFDASADGIVISEGLAMLALKRLSDAERDGDRIYAVIKGVGAGSDGRSKGLTAPEPKGQLRAMRRAYDHAGFGPDTVTLFEAHGTGTVVGDTAELESTVQLLKGAGCGAHHAAIGSVKSLIGHTKATAGVASLIKAALALHHRVIPPHYPVKHPTSVLQHKECPLYLPDQALPWFVEAGRKRRAAASAFGFGGTNFHVVLEEYTDEYRSWIRPAVSRNRSAELFVFHGRDRAQLRERLLRLRNGLAEASDLAMRHAAFNLAGDWRPSAAAMTIVASEGNDLDRKIEAAAAFLEQGKSPLPQGVYYGDAAERPGKLAVLFSGQGSQFTNMFREISLHFPVFSQYLSQADDLMAAGFRQRFGAHARLSSFIYPRGVYSRQGRTDAENALKRTDVAQPALGAVGAGLWEMMRWLGLVPEMTGGHSYGEFLALYAAGYLDFQGLMSLSAARGSLIVDAVERAGTGLGTMAAVHASREEVEKTIGDIADLVIANHNSPQQCVVSGSQSAVSEAVRRFEQAGVGARTIPVAAAFHSALIKPAQAAFADAIAGSDWHQTDPGITVYSNTTADRYPADIQRIKETLIDHLVSPVEFVCQIQVMYREGARVFLELGPKAVLTGLVRRILGDVPHTAVSVGTGEAGLSSMLDACGQLLCAGVNLKIDKLFEKRACRSADPYDLKAMQPDTAMPAGAWVLNGSGARPFTDPVAPAAIHRERPVAPAADMPSASRFQRISNHNPIAAKGDIMSNHIIREVPGNIGRRQKKVFPETDGSVMTAYFSTMRHFLETQERVMACYLGASPPSDRRLHRNTLGRNSAVALPEPFSAVEPNTTQEEPGRAPVQNKPRPVPEKQAEPGPGHYPEPATALESRQRPDASETIDRDKLTQILLSIVEDKTGYPKDMLGLDQNLEADLSIDSIKRVEIAAALLEALPPSYRQTLDGDQAKLNTQATLSGMVSVLDELKPAQEAQHPFSPSGVGSEADRSRHPLRFVIEAEPEPVSESAAKHPVQGVFVITRDRLGLAESLSEMLRARSCTPVVADQDVLKTSTTLNQWCQAVRQDHGPISAIVHLAQAGSDWFDPEAPLEKWLDQLHINEKSLFTMLHHFNDHLTADARVMSVSTLGGYFSRRSNHVRGMSLQSGAVGLLKSWFQERPEFRMKAVDMDPDLSVETAAQILMTELELAGGRQDVGYPGGRRTVFKTVASTLDPGPQQPADMRNLVVLVTGGARGVTAESIRELAVPGNTLLLTGRSALQEHEPPEFQNLSDFNAVRQHFISQVRAGNLQLNMAEIRKRVQLVMNAREMRSNMEDFRRSGAQVRYYQVDVTDEAAMQRLMEEIYSQYGRIDGIVHGAGIIEDKLLADKDPASWSRVVETKVIGLLLLQKLIRPEALKFFTVFSSVAGRYGNNGQTDYATANELMNRLCCQLSHLWSNRFERLIIVKALCWGPWGPTRFGAGMVTEFTEAKFNARGIHLVTAESGRRLFREELTPGDDTHVEIICGHGPWEQRETEIGRIENRRPPV